MIDLAQVPAHPRRAVTCASFKILQNGRIRYYDKYKPAKIPGKTAGACLVVEVDATTGNVIRTWYESYDQQNRVIRITPNAPSI